MINITNCIENCKHDSLILAAELYGINSRTSIKRKATELLMEETQECQIQSTEFQKMNTILE